MGNELATLIIIVVIAILETGLRLIPTKKDVSLISNIARLIDVILPNYKHKDNNDDYPDLPSNMQATH